MLKILSPQLNRALLMARCTSPFDVSITKNPEDETAEQIKEKQEKFLKLPESVKNKLVSPQTAEIIREIGKKYHLEFLQLADISRTILFYYFEKIKLEEISSILSEEMNIDLELAEEISQIIITKIINDDSQEKAILKQKEELNIIEALEKYPEIEKQQITALPITLSLNSSLAKPTIKNWLADYTFNIGVSNHNSAIRGDYLFKNKNCHQLSNQDRERLSSVLKSFEEKTLLTIDTEKKQIIFANPLDISQKKLSQSTISEIILHNFLKDANALKKIANEYRERNLATNELIDRAEKGDAAAAYILAEKNEITLETYATFLTHNKDINSQKAINNIIQKNRTDILIYHKFNTPEEIAKIKEEQNLPTQNDTEIYIAENAYTHLDIAHWTKQDWHKTLFSYCEEEATVNEKQKIIRDAIEKRFYSLTPEERAEIKKNINGENVVALRAAAIL